MKKHYVLDTNVLLHDPNAIHQFEDNDIVIPLKVIEDSRCPINARCVWAGRVVVSTRIDGAGWRETTNMELGRPYVTHGVGVQLSSVQPAKIAGQEIPPQAYLFGYTGG